MTDQQWVRVVDALRRAAIPLRSVRPDVGSGDLEQLEQLVGDARVVGLGESSHGVSQIFTLKHRLVAYLVEHLRFTAVAFEASYAGSLGIDDYVRSGEGQAAEALTGQGYTAWDCEEVAALVGWLRDHNEGVPDERKVAFHGLDSGYNRRGRELITGHLERVDPDLLQGVRPAFTLLDELEAKWPFRIDDADERRLTEAYPSLLMLEQSLQDPKLRRLASRMAQWAGPASGERSRHQAENLLELLDADRPDARYVVWLHNSHIGRSTDDNGDLWFGSVLEQRLGSGYRPLALEFGAGRSRTRALDPDGYSGGAMEMVAAPPPEGSLPWCLTATGTGALALDLRPLLADPDLREWLTAPQLQNQIGWTHIDDPTQAFREGVLAEEYDGVFFTPQADPSTPTASAQRAFVVRERY